MAEGVRKSGCKSSKLARSVCAGELLEAVKRAASG